MTAPSPSPKLHNSEPDQVPLWSRIVARLPQREPVVEWYRPEDLAPLLGIQRRSVYVHCNQLWPAHEGEWRLSYDDAVRLIKRAAFAGKKVKAANPLPS